MKSIMGLTTVLRASGAYEGGAPVPVRLGKQSLTLEKPAEKPANLKFTSLCKEQKML